MTVVTACGLLGSSNSISSDSIFTVIEPERFTEQSGQPYRHDVVDGKIVLINFVFTHCAHVCPTQTLSLVKLNSRLSEQQRKDTQLLSISIDPNNDTPAKLRAFSRRQGADSGNWSFVTGPAAHVNQMIEQLRLMNPAKENPELDDHKSAIWLVDQRGRVMQRYRGNPVNVERIINEVEQLRNLQAL